MDVMRGLKVDYRPEQGTPMTGRFNEGAFKEVVAQTAAILELGAAVRFSGLVTRALGLVHGVGVTLRGSLAQGRGDRYSDVDLEVLCASPAVRTQAQRAAAAVIASTGKVLATFAATHLGMPQLRINFVEFDSQLVKVDLNFVLHRPGRPGDSKGGIRLVQAEGMQSDDDVATAGAISAPGVKAFEESDQRFVGWAWYTHTKIERGEFWEADDSLGVMRSHCLLPMLRLARGLPQLGHRYLELVLDDTDLEALRRTRPAAVENHALRAALQATIALYERLSPVVALGLGQEYRLADLSRMQHLMRGRRSMCKL